MFGVVLRLLAAGDASRRLGDYVKNLMTRFIVLSVAGIVFLVAIAFAILAGYWAINSAMQNPIWSALIMMGICLFAGLAIALTAYGITRERAGSARPAPMQAAQSYIPTVDDVGREIETAVHRYGPFRVAAAAAAGGIVAGLLAKRFAQPRVVYEPEPPRSRRNGRRYGNGNGRRYA
jgi:hypothetical protein